MNNRIVSSALTIGIFLAAAVIAGCSGTGKCPFSSCPCNAGAAGAPAASSAGGCCPGGSCAPAQPAKAVNVTCPTCGGKISGQPQFVRQFNGRTVAFCSQFCAEQWDRMSDQQKQEKLDKALSPSTKPTASANVGGRGVQPGQNCP